MGRSIGILTGTFDPIHQGHVELAKAAMRASGLDEVWFLVNPDPAHKVNVLSYQHRLAMAELAVAGEPNLRMADEQLAEVPHTIAGFRRLMSLYPRDRFVFIVGMDAIGSLDRWDDVESVVKFASFAVAKRPSVKDTVIDTLKRRLRGLGDELVVQIFDFDNEASSKQAREQIQAGKRPVWLSSRVYDYIEAHGLYC